MWPRTGRTRLLCLLVALLPACEKWQAPAIDDVIRFEDIVEDRVDPEWSALGRPEATIRQRWVHYDQSRFTITAKEGALLSVEVFPGVIVSANVASVEEAPGGDLHLTGEIPKEPFGIVWLSIARDRLVGTIQTQGKFYDLFPVAPGVIRITEFDQSRFPPDHDFGDGSGARRVGEAQLGPNTIGGSPRPKPTIRVLVLYPSSSFRMYCAPTRFAMASMAASLAMEINAVWRDTAESEVVTDCVGYQPKGHLLVDYMSISGNSLNNYVADTGRSLDPDYDWLISNSIPAALRDRHDADLVALMLPVYYWCGGADTNDPPVTAADADNAYAVVEFNCSRGNYSLQHELGHLVGMRHDRGAESSDTAGNCNYGYICRRRASVVGRTVMAYKSSCVAQGGLPEQCAIRLPLYSMSSQSHPLFGQYGIVCGQPCDQNTTDPLTGSAYNHNQLRTAAPIVSQFR